VEGGGSEAAENERGGDCCGTNEGEGADGVVRRDGFIGRLVGEDSGELLGWLAQY
jgi:hypothetical protein